MDDLAAERFDACERLPDVGDSEVWEREAITGSWPAIVQPESDSALPRLLAESLPLVAHGERNTSQPLPEAAGPLRIVCRKLDERELDHAAMVALLTPRELALCSPSKVRLPRAGGHRGRARAVAGGAIAPRGEVSP